MEYKHHSTENITMIVKTETIYTTKCCTLLKRNREMHSKVHSYYVTILPHQLIHDSAIQFLLPTLAVDVPH